MLTFWVVHFGDHNVAGGVQKSGEDGYQDLLESISDSFERVDIPEVVSLLDKRFGEEPTRCVHCSAMNSGVSSGRFCLGTVAEAESAYLQLYEHHAASDALHHEAGNANAARVHSRHRIRDQ